MRLAALNARPSVLPIAACISLARVPLDRGPPKGLVQHCTLVLLIFH